MYESFYQLSRRPFLASPLVERYIPTKSLEEARQTASRVIERAEGAALVIGPAGTGKTLLCQLLAQAFRGRFETALLQSAALTSRRALLQAMLYELRMPYRGMDEGELRLALIDHLSNAEKAPAGLLLIVDEAHTLPLQALEEIRMLTNLVRGGEQRVRLALVGGPRLDERFAHPRLESFAQRLGARCYLEPFSGQETQGYVAAQVVAAGGKPEAVFTAEALAAVHRASDGVPRLVNQVCDHALILGLAAGLKPLDAAAVQEAWSDLQQLPTPWNESPHAAAGPKLASAGGDDVIEFGTLDEEPSRPPMFAGTIGPRAAAPLREAEANLEFIEQSLGDLEDEFEPSGGLVPEVELSFPELPDPFREQFAEEEIVVDRYATLDERRLRDRPHVSSRESLELARMMAGAAEPSPAAVAPRGAAVAAKVVEPARPVAVEPARPAASADDVATNDGAASAAPELEPAFDDRDLIVIEDEASGTPAPVGAKRLEYRQLFRRLRAEQSQ